MLPLDPAKQDDYRAKIRAKRALQSPTVPKGTKRPPEFGAAISAASKASPRHRSKHQSGSANTAYKDGGFLDKNGYRILSCGPDGKKYQCEHRVIMARMIGRPLLPDETVHHKNGNRSDNREENLELWSSRNPKGQRIEDKVRYAREILALYGDGVYDQNWLD